MIFESVRELARQPLHVQPKGFIGARSLRLGAIACKEQRSLRWDRRCIHFAVVGLLLLSATVAPVSAQDAFTHYITRNQGIESPQPVAEHDFGDQRDLYVGTAHFQNTDVTIPGNSSLPFSVGRTLEVGRMDVEVIASLRYGRFGNWDLDIPYMYGLYQGAKPWHVKNGDPIKRCSTSHPDPVNINSGNIFGYEYWTGNRLHVPGRHSGLVLLAQTPIDKRPQQSAAYRWVTTENWYLSCINTLARGTGEGFIAHAPNGDKYYFDWMVTQGYTGIQIPSFSGSAIPKIFLYPTKVEDKFGNSIQYQWSDDKLTGMVSNDGRSLQISYVNIHGIDRVSQITAEGRLWKYEYDANAFLQKVILPDGTFWQYNTPPFFTDTYPYPPTGPHDGCSSSLFGAREFGYTVTHPSGAKADFSFFEAYKARHRVYPKCIWDHVVQRDFNKSVARNYYAVVLTKKRVYGVGFADRIWEYTGGSPVDGTWHDCTGNCPTTVTSTVTEPGLRATRYKFGAHYGQNEGLLLEKVVLDKNGVVISQDTYTYDTQDVNPDPPYTRQMGISGYYTGFNPMLERKIPLKAVVTEAQGMRFTWNVLEFDAHARPLRVQKSSSPIQ